MILAVLFADVEGNILIERYGCAYCPEGGTVLMCGDWHCHKSVYIVYTVLGGVSLFVVGKDEYDELASSAVKEACGKPPTERFFLDKYGKICFCLDEIVCTGLLENTDRDRVRRLVRLKPSTEF